MVRLRCCFRYKQTPLARFFHQRRPRKDAQSTEPRTPLASVPLRDGFLSNAVESASTACLEGWRVSLPCRAEIVPAEQTQSTAGGVPLPHYLFFLWSLSLSWSLLSLSFIAYCADGGPSPQPSAARPGPWSDKVDRSCWSRWRPTVLWIAVVVTFYVTRHRLRRRLEAARSKRQRQHPATSAQTCQARRRHWVQTKLV